MIDQSTHPIKPPDQKLQYRAIGVIKGIYTPSTESYCTGTITTTDGAVIPSLLKHKARSIISRKTSPGQEYHWVVYPRCNSQALKVQVVGVWDPTNNSSIEEYFSVRGQVIFQNFKDKKIIVKIKQKSAVEGERVTFFKIKLTGIIPVRAVGKFWEFKVKRNFDKFDILTGEFISKLPAKFNPLNKNKQKKPVTKKSSSPQKASSAPLPAPPVNRKKVKPVEAPPPKQVEIPPTKTPKKISFLVR